MTLLVTVFAAVITTAIWYKTFPKNEMRLGVLCFMFWGASLMWLVDAIHAYIEDPAHYFRPAPEEILNDLYLGFSVIALALTIWIVLLLIRDPKGAVRASLFQSKK